MKILMERNGSFYVNELAFDRTQCGVQRGDRELHYHVEIESDSEYLDNNGFLVNNYEIQGYFDSRYAQIPVFPSCEEIACQTVEELAELIGRDRVFAIRCTIKPGQHAGITAEMCFQCRIDSSPRRAT